MQSHESYYSSKSYDSYEFLLQEVKGWDVDFIQLNQGPFSANIVHFIEHDFQFTEAFFNSHLHQRGTAPKGKLTFTIHHMDSVPNIWRYLHCPLHGIAIYPDNNELQSVAMPGMHKFTLSFEEKFLQAVSEDIGLPDIYSYITKGHVALCRPDQIDYLQRYLVVLHQYFLDSKNSGNAPGLSDEIKKEIARILLVTISTSSSELPDKKQRGRAKALEKVMRQVNSNFADLPSVSELCSLSGLTENKFSDLFYSTFQVTPEQYLDSYKENVVRKFLRGIS